MKYAFIEAQRGQHAVATLCWVLEVSSSGYYAWRKRRAGGKRERSDRHSCCKPSVRCTRTAGGGMTAGGFGLNYARKGRFAAASEWHD
jgi:hypothetical protein